jgi:hypothetical protein
VGVENIENFLSLELVKNLVASNTPELPDTPLQRRNPSVPGEITDVRSFDEIHRVLGSDMISNQHKPQTYQASTEGYEGSNFKVPIQTEVEGIMMPQHQKSIVSFVPPLLLYHGTHTLMTFMAFMAHPARRLHETEY